MSSIEFTQGNLLSAKVDGIVARLLYPEEGDFFKRAPLVSRASVA